MQPTDGLVFDLITLINCVGLYLICVPHKSTRRRHYSMAVISIANAFIHGFLMWEFKSWYWAALMSLYFVVGIIAWAHAVFFPLKPWGSAVKSAE